MARMGRRMHPGRVLREEYMEPMRLDATGLAHALGRGTVSNRAGDR